MTRFIASRLDLSRLRAIRPDLILNLDYEALLTARLASLSERLPEVDTFDNEYSPLVALQQEDAYRQLLDYALLNDTVRALLPAFATGSDLEHIAARAGIKRLEITPASAGQPASLEDDDTLRMRYFAAFGAPAAGSEDAYVFHTLTAYPAAWHVQCVGPDEHGIPGQVDIVVTAPDGASVPNETLNVINFALNGRAVRPLTDITNVMAAEVVPYTVDLTAHILRGPDPAAIRAEILARLQTITTERYRGGGEVPLAALKAAGFDAGARDVTLASPLVGIPRNPYRSPYCTGITVTVVERLND